MVTILTNHVVFIRYKAAYVPTQSSHLYRGTLFTYLFAKEQGSIESICEFTLLLHLVSGMDGLCCRHATSHATLSCTELNIMKAL